MVGIRYFPYVTAPPRHHPPDIGGVDRPFGMRPGERLRRLKSESFPVYPENNDQASPRAPSQRTGPGRGTQAPSGPIGRGQRRLLLGFDALLDLARTVIGQTGTGGDQTSDDDVFLETAQIVRLPMIAASVSTRVVSWKEAAEMNESVDSDAFVMPSSRLM
jgi:hypothetical protein